MMHIWLKGHCNKAKQMLCHCVLATFLLSLESEHVLVLERR